MSSLSRVTQKSNPQAISKSAQSVGTVGGQLVLLRCSKRPSRSRRLFWPVVFSLYSTAWPNIASSLHEAGSDCRCQTKLPGSGCVCCADHHPPRMIHLQLLGTSLFDVPSYLINASTFVGERGSEACYCVFADRRLNSPEPARVQKRIALERAPLLYVISIIYRRSSSSSQSPESF